MNNYKVNIRNYHRKLRKKKLPGSEAILSNTNHTYYQWSTQSFEFIRTQSTHDTDFFPPTGLAIRNNKEYWFELAKIFGRCELGSSLLSITYVYFLRHAIPSREANFILKVLMFSAGEIGVNCVVVVIIVVLVILL